MCLYLGTGSLQVQTADAVKMSSSGGPPSYATRVLVGRGGEIGEETPCEDRHTAMRGRRWVGLQAEDVGRHQARGRGRSSPTGFRQSGPPDSSTSDSWPQNRETINVCGISHQFVLFG